MGSGIKTVILVLLLIIAKPKVDKRKPSDYIFALEELANNLHPAIQRRLYHYLYQFAVENKCQLFLTTHSNTVIDLYSKLPDTKIFHVLKEGYRTVIKSIEQSSHVNGVLDDLDIKASDILQSNGIIWVEGPSDRTYLNKWISLKDDSLIEGFHYSIMFYGGRLLSNLTLDSNYVENDLIPLLKLNRNAFLLMDSDIVEEGKEVNATKKRISEEIGDSRYWITDGKEIENYLTNRTLNEWLSKKHGFTEAINMIKTSRIDQILSKKAGKGIEYGKNKNGYALEIVEFIEKEDIEFSDLKENINNLVNQIRRWNNIEDIQEARFD